MYYEAGFDKTVDVIVIGFGDAGAVAGMTAYGGGAEVLIVEKQCAEARRPNSRFSGGLFISPADVDAAEHYMRQLYRINDDLYETDPALIRIWAKETSQNASWLRAQGGECHRFLDHGEHRHIEGYDSIHLYKPDMNAHPNGSRHSGWGWGLFKFLSDQVISRGVPVMYGTRAKWLLTNAAGDVIGVQSDDGARITNIGARKGVVLASGGFEFNDWLQLNYLRVTHTLYYELINMDSQRLVYPKIPSWWIFDNRRFKTGPLTPTFMGPTGPLQQIPWSADNQAEVERGWVLSAGGIEELARKCDMEPSVLAETVRRYNRACADGYDPDFRRPAATMTPLEGPTYYAVRLWPGGPNTQGGPRRNADGQEMRVTGEPVPGL